MQMPKQWTAPILNWQFAAITCAFLITLHKLFTLYWKSWCFFKKSFKIANYYYLCQLNLHAISIFPFASNLVSWFRFAVWFQNKKSGFSWVEEIIFVIGFVLVNVWKSIVWSSQSRASRWFLLEVCMLKIVENKYICDQNNS